MKTSNKILVIVAAVVAAAVVASVLASRIMVDRAVEMSGVEKRAESSVERGDYVSKEYSATDFRRLRFTGGWKAELRQGEEYAVILRFPENYRSYLSVKTQGRLLDIDFDHSINMGGRHLEAEIVMPELTEVESLGGIDLQILGFSGDELSLTVKGGSNIRGDGGAYERIALNLQGGSNVDLLDLPAENVRVDATGAANVKVRMSGGDLTGSISGAGAIKYTGTVRRQDVTTSGVTSVGRLD